MWEGIDLQPDFMTETLKNVFAIWGRPVNLTTAMDNEGMLYRFDGQEFKNFKVGPQKAADPLPAGKGDDEG
jgi:stage V sporulation protein R